MARAASFNFVRLGGAVGLVIFGFAALTPAGAETPANNATDEPCPASAARIVLWHSRKVTLNDTEVPTERLGSALAALKPRPTAVCYAQENPNDASPALGSFMEGLIFMRMPLFMYLDTSFVHRAASF